MAKRAKASVNVAGKARMEREIEAAVGVGDWGPATPADAPPDAGAVLDVDGSSYTIAPASIRIVRDAGERWLARIAKRNQDDAWLVISPRGYVRALIVGNSRYWSIYRRAGDASWRKDQGAEVFYWRGVEDGWRDVVRGIVKMTI